MLTAVGTVCSVVGSLVLAALLLRWGPEQLRSSPTRRDLLGIIGTANALILVALTELLSSLGQLHAGPLLAAWPLVLAAQAPAWRRMVRALATARAPAESPEGLEWGLLGAIIAIAVVSGISGLASAPNTWDALLYHLARVAHWIQNGSVGFFPTSNERQLFFPPFAEYALLHLDLLVGGDRLAAWVQWVSFLACLLGVSLIARELGAGRRGQVLAAFFAGTIPTAVLEASSTQNDLVATLWLVWFTYHSIRFARRGTRFDACAAGAALGLGLLTKLTVHLLVPGLALGFLAQSYRARAVRGVPVVAVALAFAASIPAAFTARNLSAYGALVASRESRTAHAAAERSAAALAANLFRGVALHLSVPPVRLGIPERARELVHAFEQRAGLPRPGGDLDAADWRYTGSREDRAGAPIHLFLLLGLLGYMAVRPKGVLLPSAGRWLLAGLAIGALVLTAALQWNPWAVRFHMTLFMLAAPLAGLIAERRLGPAGIGLSSAFLLLSGGYSLLWNQLHPPGGLQGAFRSDRRTGYLAAWDSVQRASLLSVIGSLSARPDSVIGLDIADGGPEYPIWVLTRGVREGRRRLCHVEVQNRSAAFITVERCAPSLVVSNRKSAREFFLDRNRFGLLWRHGEFGVYAAPGDH